MFYFIQIRKIEGNHISLLKGTNSNIPNSKLIFLVLFKQFGAEVSVQSYPHLHDYADEY